MPKAATFWDTAAHSSLTPSAPPRLPSSRVRAAAAVYRNSGSMSSRNSRSALKECAWLQTLYENFAPSCFPLPLLRRSSLRCRTHAFRGQYPRPERQNRRSAMDRCGELTAPAGVRRTANGKRKLSDEIKANIQQQTARSRQAAQSGQHFDRGLRFRNHSKAH